MDIERIKDYAGDRDLTPEEVQWLISEHDRLTSRNKQLELLQESHVSEAKRIDEEWQKLTATNTALLETLRLIHTWAVNDELVPTAVARACERAMEGR